jgi:cytidyltransferase-like protein
MMIGLFFGSFNPIHQGHLMVLRYWLNETPLHQIWLIVSPQNPHKSPEDLAPAQDRLVMTQLAIQSESRLHASDIEFFLPRPSYTIDTLRHLQTQYPTYEWCLLLGADTFATLPTWKEGLYPSKPLYPLDIPTGRLCPHSLTPKCSLFLPGSSHRSLRHPSANLPEKSEVHTILSARSGRKLHLPARPLWGG